MTKEQLWVRCGDGDGYHAFATTEEVAEYLAQNGAVPPLSEDRRYGVCCFGFEGQNYISLYWGWNEESPSRSVTDDERITISQCLEQLNLD